MCPEHSFLEISVVIETIQRNARPAHILHPGAEFAVHAPKERNARLTDCQRSLFVPMARILTSNDWAIVSNAMPDSGALTLVWRHKKNAPMERTATRPVLFFVFYAQRVIGEMSRSLFLPTLHPYVVVFVHMY